MNTCLFTITYFTICRSLQSCKSIFKYHWRGRLKIYRFIALVWSDLLSCFHPPYLQCQKNHDSDFRLNIWIFWQSENSCFPAYFSRQLIISHETKISTISSNRIDLPAQSYIMIYYSIQSFHIISYHVMFHNIQYKCTHCIIFYNDVNYFCSIDQNCSLSVHFKSKANGNEATVKFAEHSSVQ